MVLKNILEAALFAAARPLSLAQLQALFDEAERPETAELRRALSELGGDYAQRPLELREVASGYRFQVRTAYSPWISRLFEERPGRYSKAFLETLAIIAYRQPVTRGEIEDIRGVAVSTQIIKTLQERDWIQVVGHKEVPGRPGLYATNRNFLDYFNLRSLDDLPPLQTFIDRLAQAAEPELPEPVPTLEIHEPSETPAPEFGAPEESSEPAESADT
ncbi:SMC-Scp complex subunit ScpB [Methylococcus sp. EFPC2]|uniref:SMC-Scp complex subunit ScpB n=1 Tax=Methylococcus sp. EFPC2 TaxID=2812648 RepID=UPI001967317A|nr:SMC-Scp complex subunit ScpB [Methylococcus sp. EFPC2]QSA98357.1 SMC-Scp complex subunit ScpB [Methylococcus sp. EFPC2]